MDLSIIMFIVMQDKLERLSIVILLNVSRLWCLMLSGYFLVPGNGSDLIYLTGLGQSAEMSARRGV
ncbi:MAG TPA: hypothetical protein VN372_09380 [Methanospirillum sp.]|nr:hypothetical protein [Methanospirillum sp.]